MPTVTVSPSTSSHSWSAVYWSAVWAVIGSAFRGAAVEGERGDRAGDGSPADVDVEDLCPVRHCGERGRVDEGHRDGVAERRRERARGHGADDRAVEHDVVARAGSTAALGHQAD